MWMWHLFGLCGMLPVSQHPAYYWQAVGNIDREAVMNMLLEVNQSIAGQSPRIDPVSQAQANSNGLPQGEASSAYIASMFTE